MLKKQNDVGWVRRASHWTAKIFTDYKRALTQQFQLKVCTDERSEPLSASQQQPVESIEVKSQDVTVGGKTEEDRDHGQSAVPATP